MLNKFAAKFVRSERNCTNDVFGKSNNIQESEVDSGVCQKQNMVVMVSQVIFMMHRISQFH